MADPITLTVIGAGVGIANIVSDFFMRAEQNAQRELDRAESARLQEALTRVAEAIQNDNGAAVALTALGLPAGFVQTLEQEAAALDQAGFKPAFELYDNGVGLVHRRAESDAVLIWLELDYPTTPPKILLVVDGHIEDIPFDDGAWAADDWRLSDVLLAIPARLEAGGSL